ncbi:MAG: ABC transporter substrate-binding protein [Actinomycetota bacterium]
MRTPRRLLALGLSAALVVAACGSDDDSADDASASESASESDTGSATDSASASEPSSDSASASGSGSASASAPAADGDTKSFTDDLGRTVEVPVDPQRIVAFNEFSHVEPLLALGAPVVGSTVQGDGEINAPTAAAYDVSGITGIGGFAELNVEAIADLDPDLILAYSNGGQWFHNVEPEVLQEIAPTVALDENKTRDDFHRAVAELVGYTDEFEEQRIAYFDRIEEVRSQLPDGLSVVVLAGPFDGNISIHSITNPNPTASIPTDLGLPMPPAAQAEDIYVSVSPELILEEFEADVILYEARGAEVVDTRLWNELPAVQAGQAYSVETAAGTSYLHSMDVLAEIEGFLVDADASVVDESYDTAPEAVSGDDGGEAQGISINDSYEVEGFGQVGPAPTMLELVEDRGDTLVVQHAFGEVEIPADAQRIYSDASMLPTAIELDLNWVGAEYYNDSVNLPDWEEDSADAEFLNEATYQTNFEAVAALDPDLILAYGDVFWGADDPDEHYELMSRVAPTLVPMGDPVAYFQTLARELGVALGIDEAEISDRITSKTQELVDACAPMKAEIGDETVGYLLAQGGEWYLNGISYNAEDGSLSPVADSRWLYEFCGFRAPNIVINDIDEWGITISEELLPSIDADHLFVISSGYSPEEREDAADFLAEAIDNSALWEAIPAVQNDNVYLMNYFSALSFDTASSAIASANEAFAGAG